MKQITFIRLALLSLFFCSNLIEAQVVRLPNGLVRVDDRVLRPRVWEDKITLSNFNRASNDISSEVGSTITHKKYLNRDYKKAIIDEKKGAYLRYNIYLDEMEFFRDEKLYYLKKETGKRVRFTNLGTVYQIYNINGGKQFFKISEEINGKALLMMQSIQYIKFKPAQGYAKAQEADFRRLKDRYYYSFDGENAVKIPKGKKAFYEIMGSKASEIKSYMKKNKLSYKNVEDLKRILTYYESI